jgi:hypothetical protein
MPPVIASAVVGAVGLTGITATIATAAIGFAASAALSSFAVKPASNRGVGLSDRSEMIRSGTAPRRVVYGQARVSGPIAFAHTTNGPTGARNALLHLVVPLAAHEIEGVQALYVNEEAMVYGPGAQGWQVPPGGSKYFNGAYYDGVTNSLNFLQWRLATGSALQAADPFLLRDVNVWSDAHRLRGVAYIYARLYWNSGIWAGGLPNLSVLIKGRKVYDPRTGQTAWSDNPALYIRDYLVSSFGLNCAADELDEDSFIAAAHLCDELVPTGTGTEQKRYTCNGVLSLDDKPIEVMERLLSSCAGTLVYAQGRYKLYPAAYRAPVLSLDRNILRDGVKVRPQPPRRERANTLHGTFINPARNWLASEFVPVTNAAYRAADGGERIGRDLELAFTADNFTAQRLAKIQLERARRSLTVELPCTLAALDVAVMEPVRLSLPELGWADKVFLPVEWTFTNEGGINLVLQEEDPSLYAWSGGTSNAAAPEVVLPSLIPSAPLLSLSDAVSAGSLNLLISLSGEQEAFFSRYEVEYKPSQDTAYMSAGSGSSVSISGVTAGVSYDVRARSINVFGAASPWSARSWQVLGGSAPPGDIEQVNASVQGGTLYLEWSAASGAISHYRVRWSPLTTSALWSSAVDVAPRVTNVRAALPARQGSYLIRAIDGLGRESANAIVYENKVADSSGSLISTLTEHPAFAGVKTNASVNGSNQLIIASLSAFDAQSGNFDTPAGNFDTAAGGTAAMGVYECASVIDLGARFVARVTARVQASVIDLVTDVDGAPGAFDTREGLFEGTAPSAVDVVVDVATTDSNPSGSPVWSRWQPVAVSDVVGRGFKFRARLLTQNPMATPALEQLVIQLELADRVAAGSNAVSATAGDTITFAPAFYSTPAISVTPTNLATGDYAVITARSRTGFTVQFRNAAGTGVSRSYDWSARGSGREN